MIALELLLVQAARRPHREMVETTITVLVRGEVEGVPVSTSRPGCVPARQCWRCRAIVPSAVLGHCGVTRYVSPAQRVEGHRQDLARQREPYHRRSLAASSRRTLRGPKRREAITLTDVGVPVGGVGVDAPSSPKLGRLHHQVLQPNASVRNQRPNDFQVALRKRTVVQSVGVGFGMLRRKLRVHPRLGASQIRHVVEDPLQVVLLLRVQVRVRHTANRDFPG